METPATPLVTSLNPEQNVSNAQSEDNDAALIDIAKKRMQLSREYTKPYFDRFLDNYKHYFLRTIDEAVEADPEAYPFYSQLMLPISYQVIETIIPRMFSRLPAFNLKTEEKNDEAIEMGFKELIRYQMNHPYLLDDPMYARLTTGLKEMFITGNSWGEVPWYMKEVEVVEWQPYSDQLGITDPSWDNMAPIMEFGVRPQWKLVKVKKKIIDAPVYQNKSVFHIFPDPKKKRVSELGWAFDEEFMTKEEIFTMANAAPRYFQNMDKFKEMNPGVIENSGGKEDNYDEQLANMFGSTDFTYRDTTQGQYKVWFMKERERLVVIVNESLVIRSGDNPNGDGKLGLILMKDIPIPHELYAWGEPDPIKKIEDAMSDQANMRNDNVFYDLMRMWKLNPETLVDGEEFIPEPGTVVQMNNLQGLEPLETGSTKPSAYREYNEWEKIIQNVSGVSDYATGSADEVANQTKGGIEALQQAANARFAQKLNLFEHVGLDAIGSMFVSRNMRFFDTPQPINTANGKVVITPDDIRKLRGNIHFITTSGSTESGNQAKEIKKWSTLIPMLGKPPFDNLTQEAQTEWGRRTLYALEETDDVNKLMEKAPPPEPIDPMAALNPGAGGDTVPAGAPTGEQPVVAQPPVTTPVVAPSQTPAVAPPVAA